MHPLALEHCSPSSGAERLDGPALVSQLATLPAWTLHPGPPDELRREFKFANFHEVMAFVNAVAWIAHGQDHHPDLEMGYQRVLLRFSTHDAGGLTRNDLICAARVDALLPQH